MHRVELKVEKGRLLEVATKLFLMHRVELKVRTGKVFSTFFSLFLMHRVELKGAFAGCRVVSADDVPNAPCGVESVACIC